MLCWGFTKLITLAKQHCLPSCNCVRLPRHKESNDLSASKLRQSRVPMSAVRNRMLALLWSENSLHRGAFFDLQEKISTLIVNQEIFKVRKQILPYRSYTQGNPSDVIFRHGTQFFHGYNSRVAWILSWRICLCRFVSFNSKQRKTFDAAWA